MKPNSNEHVSQACLNQKNAFEHAKSVKKTQECIQGLEKWIQAGEDFIKGEDFIDVEPERGMN